MYLFVRAADAAPSGPRHQADVLSQSAPAAHRRPATMRPWPQRPRAPAPLAGTPRQETHPHGQARGLPRTGPAPTASDEQLKAAWRRLVSRWHPDRNPSRDAASRTQRINKAYHHLRGLRDEEPEAPPAARPAPKPTAKPAARPAADKAAPPPPPPPHSAREV